MSSSSSEYSESGGEDDEILFKPTFVPKSSRITRVDAEAAKQLEEIERKKALDEQEKRRKESYDMLAKQLKKEFVQFGGGDGDEEDYANFNGIDDTDDVDREAEYLAWKVRALKRAKRDKFEGEKFISELEELEKRREMTDKERRVDDLESGIDRFKRDKGNMQFMQKYYHKGAFYQDMDIMKRDYTAPTVDEALDKKVLPEVLQVKNFGLASRSKWTHLANEDTTDVSCALNFSI